MRVWKDSTGYSQGDKDRTPTSWTSEKDGVRVTVTRGHRDYRGEWVMHCYALCMDTVHLGIPSDATPDGAQNAALVAAQQRAERIMGALP